MCCSTFAAAPDYSLQVHVKASSICQAGPLPLACSSTCLPARVHMLHPHTPCDRPVSCVQACPSWPLVRRARWSRWCVQPYPWDKWGRRQTLHSPASTWLPALAGEERGVMCWRAVRHSVRISSTAVRACETIGSSLMCYTQLSGSRSQAAELPTKPAALLSVAANGDTCSHPCPWLVQVHLWRDACC